MTNVLLVAIDTLRADHLGCYGYGKATSPVIDARLARRGTRFEQCFSVSNCTLPGYTSIFTGLYPTSHDIVAHGNRWPVRPGVRTAGELLAVAGYDTAMVSSLADYGAGGEHLTRGVSKHQFAQVNDAYKDLNPSFEQTQGGLVVPAPRVSAQAVDTLEGLKEPFFLFVHFWDPHTPYIPPIEHDLFYDGRDPCDPRITALDQLKASSIGRWFEDWGRRLDARYKGVTDPARVVSLYDGEIHHADRHVGVVLDKLDELGLTDDTAVILTSDHGETMDETNNLICGERAMFSHVGLTDPNCSVPLVVAVPGLAGGNLVEGMASQVDILPTVLDIAGVQASHGAGFDGASLLPVMTGDAGEIPPTSCELGDPTRGPWCRDEGRVAVLLVENTYQKQRAVRTQRWKFIEKRDAFPSMPSAQLYDLYLDPGEHRNIVDEAGPVAAILRGKLDAWVLALCARHDTTDPQERFPLTLRDGFTHRTRAAYKGFDEKQVFT